MKKQLKLLLFVAMLVTLAVMTMVVAAAEDDAFGLTKAGGTYATLADAFEAAQDGDTVTVLRDVVVDKTATVPNKNLTLDGANKTVTVNITGAGWLAVGDDVTLTVKNLVAVKGATAKPTGIIAITGKGIVNVTDSNLDNRQYEYDAASRLTGAIMISASFKELNLTNCTLRGYHGIMINDTKKNGQGKLEINGGTYEGVGWSELETPENYETIPANGDGCAIWNPGGVSGMIINVRAGTLIGRAYAIKAQVQSTISVYGGTLTATNNTGVGDSTGAILFHKKGSTVNIYGGTLTTEYPAAILNFYRGGTVNIYGGTIDSTGSVIYARSHADVVGSVVNIAESAEATADIKILVKGGNFLQVAGNKVTSFAVNLGQGAEIRMQNESSFFVNNKGVATVNVTGAAAYYAENGVLPNLGENWKAATFYVVPSVITLPAGNYTIESALEQFESHPEWDGTMAAWDPTASKHTPANVVLIDGEAIPGMILGEGVTMTVESGTYTGLKPNFFDIRGGTVEIKGGTFKAAAAFTANDALIALRSGTLTITGASTRFVAENWTALSAFILVEGGNLTINCPSSGHTPQTSDFADNYSAANSIEDANFYLGKGGSMITIATAAANVTVEDGVFLKNNATPDASIMFYFKGNYETDMEVAFTVNGGYFYGASIIRVLAYAYTDVTDETLGTTTRTLYDGCTVTLNGGTFVGNAVETSASTGLNMFQIQAPGYHEIVIPADSTLKAYASKYQTNVFYVNRAGSKATGSYGAEISISAGTYQFAKGFLSCGELFTDVTVSVKDVTLTQTAVADLAEAQDVISFCNNMQTGSKNQLTLENVNITATNGAALSLGCEGLEVTILGGMYVGNRVIAIPMVTVEEQEVEAAAPAISVQGGIFIQKGEGSVFGYENVEVSGNALVLAPAGAIYSGTKVFDSYAPVIKYAGDSYKFWTELEGAEAGAPEIELGASIYLGADGQGDDKADCGIRFDSSYNSESVPDGYSWINDDETESGLGHLIAPADYVAKVIELGGSFTHASFEEFGIPYLDIRASIEVLSWDEDDVVVSYAAAIFNLKSTTRAYAAVPYAVFTNDSTGEEEYFYGAYDAVENSRSAEQIAYNYCESGDPIYTTYDVMAQYYTPTASVSEEE